MKYEVNVFSPKTGLKVSSMEVSKELFFLLASSRELRESIIHLPGKSSVTLSESQPED